MCNDQSIAREPQAVGTVELADRRLFPPPDTRSQRSHALRTGPRRTSSGTVRRYRQGRKQGTGIHRMRYVVSNGHGRFYSTILMWGANYFASIFLRFISI